MNSSSMSEGDAPAEPPAPFKLLPVEWVALLPHAAGRSNASDPAGARRASDPLTSTRLLELLPDPLLRGVVRFQLLVARLRPPRSMALVSLLHIFLYCATTAITPVFNAGYFAVPQLAAGLATVYLFLLVNTLALIPSVVTAGRLGIVSSDTAAGDSCLGAPARWQELVLYSAVRTQNPEAVEDKGDTAASSRSSLIIHNDNEGEHCPCPSPACSGGLARKAAVVRLALMPLLGIVVFVALDIIGQWTPIVTFASITWTTAWSTIVVVLQFLTAIPQNYFIAFAFASTSFGLDHGRFTAFTRRLRRRAMKLALDSMLDRHEHAFIHGPSNSPITSTFPGHETYAELHTQLAIRWQEAAHPDALLELTMFYTVLPVVCSVVNMIAGSCIPAIYISSLVIVLFMVSGALSTASASNASISDICDLYIAAQRRARELAAAYPQPSATLHSLRAHDALLSSCITDADRAGAKVLGFRIGRGTIRAAIATLLTIAVGLWGILRGLGIRITMDIACPR
ncbi:hypothetical protein DFJ74DRAFT_657448, partial [Hyaloraphidium curvatum]